MAHPKWFSAARIGPAYSQESVIGGTLGFNNPTKEAFEEAKRIFGAESKASMILSLGSGRRHPKSLNSHARDVLDDMAHNGEQNSGRVITKAREFQLLSSIFGRFRAGKCLDDELDRG